MAQFPDNVPTGYAGDATDFLKVKRDTFGAMRRAYDSIAVADGATAGTTYGLIPFQKGASVGYGSKFYTPDLDTDSNVTWNLGYLYSDTSLTSDADAFISAGSGQSAAVLTFDENEGMSFVAEGSGWITAELAAGPVTTAGTVEISAELAYDDA